MDEETKAKTLRCKCGARRVRVKKSMESLDETRKGKGKKG